MTKDEAKVVLKYIELTTKAVFKEASFKDCAENIKALNAIVEVVNKYTEDEKPEKAVKNAIK